MNGEIAVTANGLSGALAGQVLTQDRGTGS